MAHPLWPLFDLRLRSERLELRLATDDELADLCAVAEAGIHPPDEMPFAFAWTDTPPAEFGRQFAQYHWRTRGAWRADDWVLDLTVFLGGAPIGVQGIRAHDFPHRRVVETGSWLGRPFQGRGFGKEARTAILALAFDGLGAAVAESGAFRDSPASAAVSRSLGYEENGVIVLAPRGEARDCVRFRMTRAAWRSRPRPPVDIDGLAGCLQLFGLAND
jgi:RimJ/RimL family protein N-acetyltransferase